MALINRISRLFRADLHDILDRVEQPAVVVKQAIREMEEELHRNEHTLRLLTGEEERYQSRFNELDNSLKEIEDQLEVCFQSDNEELAKRLLKRRLENQNLQKQLTKKLRFLKESINQKKSVFDQNLGRLGEIRQKADLLVEDSPDEILYEDFVLGKENVVRDEDIEVAYLREKQKWSQS